MTDQVATSASSSTIELAADIVSAYVTKNSLPAGELPALIGRVHEALSGLSQPVPAPAEKLTPPVSIKKSLTPDAIISMEDGKPYKSMKRHLAKRGLTPEQYREKWGLPRDYPMVSQSYAAVRSALAKKAGLGQQRLKAAAKAAATSEKVSAPAPKKGGKGRRKAS